TSTLNTFAVSGYPSSTTAGTAHTFTVTVIDDDGTTMTGYTGTVHFSSSDWQADLPADYTFTAADHAVHTFTATLKTAGWQRFQVADATYGGIAGGQAVQVTPAGLSALNVAGFPSPILAGSAGNFFVWATDAYSNLISDYAGTVHFSSSDPSAALPADYT